MEQLESTQIHQKSFQNTIKYQKIKRDQKQNIETSSRLQIDLEMENNNKIPLHSYRADIDGLRTIAIVSVVIFHAFPEYLPGGFVGVDLFFVISGYLITQIIIKETNQKSFSYINFYSRRIRRIYPALIFVLAFVLYVVPRYYGHTQLDFTLNTLNASVIFGANLQILTHQKDYFDPDIHSNPLLHLWSLGVQQQFYIFWPILISMSIRFFQKRTFLVLSLYTAISFFIGIKSVFISPKFAFYFPICRFWQMAIGGIIAYKNITISNKRINNILSLIGTLFILISVWIINEQSLFPGFWAIVPTLGSAFIIQAGQDSQINKKILGSKIFVFIGKISYPLYLWHWPLLVFSRYFYPQGSSSIYGNLYFIILISFGLSIITYFFVQNPIRKSKSKIIIITLLIFMTLIGSWSYINLRASRIKNNYFDKDQIEQLLINAQKQYHPHPQDFVQLNGKMIPNLSKNKIRQTPSVDQTKIPIWSFTVDKQNFNETILQKNITQGSKYYVKDRPYIKNFQVANEGKQKQLFIIGDSHGLKISYRFQQLFYDSVTNNKTDSFPTIVAIIRTGNPLVQQNYILNFSLSLLQIHKPQRVLLACHWLTFLVKDKNSLIPQYYQDKMKLYFDQFFNFIKAIKAMGIEVSVLTIDLHSRNYDPRNMVDFYGIVPQNIKAVKQSEFKNRYKRLYDRLQQGLKNLNVKVINTMDNLCWQDTCYVTTPNGYAVYEDDNHYSKFFTRHWMSCVDHLVQF